MSTSLPDRPHIPRLHWPDPSYQILALLIVEKLNTIQCLFEKVRDFLGCHGGLVVVDRTNSILCRPSPH